MEAQFYKITIIVAAVRQVEQVILPTNLCSDDTPAYLMFPLSAEEHQNIDQFVAKLTRNIQTAHNGARTQLKTTLKRMKRDYDLRGVVKRNYQGKDIFYLLDTAMLKGS